MAQNTATTDGGIERETKRFEDDVDFDDLIPGDRISRDLVVRDHAMLDAPKYNAPDDQEEPPEAQVVVVSQIDTFNSDVVSALLLDPDAETYAIASRHDSNSAMTQRQVDWKVRDVGEHVTVTEVKQLERPEDEQDMPADEYAQEWVEVVFEDLRQGYNDYQEECEMTSRSTLRLKDYDGRELYASVELE